MRGALDRRRVSLAFGPSLLIPAVAVAGALLGSAGRLAAQVPGPAAMEALLERLVGQWQMTGSVRGRLATYTLDVTRVLQGRFIELHIEDVHHPPAYEARVFIGVDSAHAEYVAHWLDSFGAAYSSPHATGAASGDTVRLSFPYPTGAFHDTFVYDRSADSWSFRLEAADSPAGSGPFAAYRVRRR